MTLSRFFGRRDARSTRRPTARRPTVDCLEGRKLLSTVTPVGHTPAPAAIQGNHIGTPMASRFDLNPQPLPPGIM